MQAESAVNRTVNDLHPCYNSHDLTQIFTSSASFICALLYMFFGSLSVITICGNLLVIISIIYFKQLHTPTNSLILSLAVADLLVGIIVIPSSTVFSLSSCLYYKHVFCKVRDSFDMILCTSSLLNLCCISIDRYHAVCLPLTYRIKMNYHAVVVMILASWTVAVVAGLAFSLSEHGTCTKDCPAAFAIVNTMGFILSFYLPVVIILCIYMKIFLVAQRQVRSIHNTTKCRAAVSKMERKATKTLAIVMGVFLMCWLPFFLCITFVSFIISVPLSVIETLNWLVLTNSLLNPFIYAFFYSWFRSAFRMIITGKIFLGDFTNSKLYC